MNRNWLIGGAVVGGGLLTWLAVREREPIAQFVAESAAAQVEGAKQAVRAAKKGIIKMTDAAQTIWSKLRLPSEAEQNIVKYHIGELIDKYRGPIPKWMALGIIHTETGGTFDPLIYNYPYNRKIQGHDHAKQDPANTYGEGWFKYNPHAIGLFQILQSFTKDFSRYGGFDHTLSIRELLDSETNIRAGLANLKIQWAKRIPSKASDADKLTMLYFSHNQGGGSLDKGLKAAANKLSGSDVIKAAGAAMAGRPLTVALDTATRGELWQQLGALGEIPVGQVETGEERIEVEHSSAQSAADDLIAQAQAAEMAGDLDKALEIREQLDVLFPDMFIEDNSTEPQEG